ncbi:hypothetical protein FOL47_001189 [Perkinsus chesapeaki]|uniref:Uncharacterized protein n=1 Tax=Perkinsus chesapeaki TaxID=330153 RepID=A0A7J6MK45_PERCH|nr:hypothetical protein FOL47_001189 [Perkinsus chesapeaki]
MTTSLTSAQLCEYTGGGKKVKYTLEVYSILSLKKLTAWFAMLFVASCMIGCPPECSITAGVYKGNFDGNTMQMNVPKAAETDVEYYMGLGFVTPNGVFTCEPTLCTTDVDPTNHVCTPSDSCRSKIRAYIGVNSAFFAFSELHCKYYVDFSKGPHFEVVRTS